MTLRPAIPARRNQRNKSYTGVTLEQPPRGPTAVVNTTVITPSDSVGLYVNVTLAKEERESLTASACRGCHPWQDMAM